MLRPTESRILWLQQFGRGLRKTAGDKQLTVIDYIGNHRTFLLKPQTLFNLQGGGQELLNLLANAAKFVPAEGGRAVVRVVPGTGETTTRSSSKILLKMLDLPGAGGGLPTGWPVWETVAIMSFRRVS